MSDVEKWKQRFERERAARKEAEKLLEDKSRELFDVNEKLLITLEDMEQRVIERTEALSDAVVKAQEANKAKSAFLATMSHEIRTPMNAVIGLTDLCIRKTSPNSQQLNYLNKIYNSAHALLKIINDILDFSKIEAGEMQIDKVHFSLGQIIQNLSNLVSDKVREKNLEFIISRSAQMIENYVGDPIRIGQVLLNLTYNAIKFTDEGHVKISITAPEVTQDYVTLEFSVLDTGIGMSKEQQEKLFMPFSQVDDTDTRKYEGTGLGLAIAKNLVKQMGGKIGVESQPGQGSVFTFTVQLEIAKEQSALNLQMPPFLSKKRVALIDKNKFSRDPIKKYLNECGLKVFTYTSIEELYSSDGKFDIYVFSVSDPDGGFMESLHSLRQEVHQELTGKVILITNIEDDEIPVADKTGYFDASIQKPIDPSFLFDAILELFGHEITKDARYFDSSDLESDMLAGIQGAKILLVEDNELNQLVASEILVGAKFFVDLATNGAEAIEMLCKKAYDCVLMDIQMPVMGGYEATRQIRQNPSFANLPIIAMTANAMVSDRKAALAAGMNDHVAKPINISKLFIALKKVIESKERPLPEVTDTAKKYSDVPDVDGLNVQTSIDNLGGDKSIYLEILNSFRFVGEKMREDLLEAQAGNNQTKELGIVHTLKGLCGTVGAQAIESDLIELESQLRANNTENCDQLREKISADVHALIERIDFALMQNTEEVAAMSSPVQLDLKDLLDLVESFDVSSLTKIDELIQTVENQTLKKRLEKISAKVSKYEFDQAALELKALISEMTSAGKGG